MDSGPVERIYFNRLRNHALLDKESEYDLIRRYQNGDNQALEELIKFNQRLVIKQANRLLHIGDVQNDIQDLVQWGNIGLMQAAKRFDLSRNLRFSTYAVWWILSYIRRWAMRDRIIHIPFHLQDDKIKVNRAETVLSNRLKRKPTLDELETECGVKKQKILEVQDLFDRPMSLDSKPKKNESNCDDFYTLIPQEARDDLDPQLSTEKLDTIRSIHACLSTLPAKERQVLELRYGLHDNHERTMKEVGEIMGVSRERIRQIEASAKTRIRATLTSTSLNP